MTPMAANDARARIQAALDLTQRLTTLIREETRLVEARQPLASEPEERSRLVNAYRLELARIKQDQHLVREAPSQMIAALKQQTETLQREIASHETALKAVKLVTEGLVHAMAEEVGRQRGAGSGYSARGAPSPANAATSALIDRSA
jgi:hypothetical protein